MVNLTREYLFPTPVYQVSLEDPALLNVYLKSRLYSWRQRDRSGLASGAGNNMGVWQSVNTMHEMQEFRLFNQQIQRCMDEVLKDQQQSSAGKLWCSAMCADISGRFGYDQPLTENTNGWQGLYFVQAPVDSGAVVFQNPRKENRPGSANSPCQHQESIYEAVAGRVLVFPAWLSYHLLPNRSRLAGEEGERISIRFAFNAAETETN